MKQIVSTLVCLLLTAGSALYAADRRAPGFSLPDSRMTQHDLSDYRGKVVILEFFQTGCPKCIEIVRTIEDIKVKYKNQVQVIGVVNPPDNLNTVAGFIKNQQVNHPIVFDCGQMTASYLRLTPANPSVHFPHMFIIDQNGMIRHELDHLAQINTARLVSLIDPILKPGAPAAPAKPAAAKK